MAVSTPATVNESVAINHEVLRSIFDNCADIVFRPLKLADRPEFLLVYIEELTDSDKLEQIISACMISRDADRLTQYRIVNHFPELVAKILKGSTAIFLDGKPFAYVADLTSFKQRSINEPTNEASIRGPREGFTEDLKTNLSMIRRKIIIFPYFSMVRFINYLEFIQNMDVWIMFIWIFSVFVKLAIYLFINSYGTAQLIGIKNWRAVIGFAAIAIFTISLVPANIIGLLDYAKFVWIIYIFPIFIVGLPIILLLVSHLRGRSLVKGSP
ncbi:GerAB/ArcD/ProY family transporter [Bacillus sp. 3255]|uniref:GerAB/ArcD/ProY family transporter n=1 Tax=Bacillus sp. 3255 TaxID=2817904 RepID=UPI0028544090|nr:GerAB/ArcD/ProY family transporter [Bacillus sp. 3255]MDR6884152.1 hypothetical protein [Bacillus sp. 3255]